jgi:Response regulators consisting of a CheY-like receiver domain and a winged-helix DNA-binding domain
MLSDNSSRAAIQDMNLKILSGVTIVLLEDHDRIGSAMAEYLRLQGAKVIVSSDAVDGLRAVRDHRPDIVISAIRLPNQDGFEFLRYIRALETEDGISVPVIAMTVGGQMEDRDRVIAAGFQAHLDKPFGSDELLEAVKSVLINQAPLA